MATGYQHIVCNPDKCMGCRICEYACSAIKTGAFDPGLSLIRVVRFEPTTMTAISCRLCEDAPCIPACPRGALFRSEQDGVILVDEVKCDGCGWCLEACDFGAIVLNPSTNHAAICDLCRNEPGKPPCVEFCPTEALSLATPEVLRQRARREVAARVIEELLDG